MATGARSGRSGRRNSDEQNWLRLVKRQAGQRRHRSLQTERRRLSAMVQRLRQPRRGLYSKWRPRVSDQKLRTLRRVGPQEHERDRGVEETAREQTGVKRAMDRKSAESHARWAGSRAEQQTRTNDGDRMKKKLPFLPVIALCALATVTVYAQVIKLDVPKPELQHNVKAEKVTYQGKPALRVTGAAAGQGDFDDRVLILPE